MEKIKISKDDYIEYKHKLDARKIVAKALKLGELQKPYQCDLCETLDDLEAHHTDYGRPLDVIWLCSVCHGLAHRKNHPLNPANYKQTRCYTEWTGAEYVPVTVSLPVENFIAIKKQAAARGVAFSRLLRGAIIEAYPVDDGQLNFSFMEEFTHAKQGHKQLRTEKKSRIFHLAENAEPMQQPEKLVLSSLWRARGDDLQAVARRFSHIPSGNGANPSRAIGN